MTFAFEYPFIHSFEFFNNILDNAEFLQPDERLVELEVKYENTFSNSLTLMINVALILFLHICMLPFAKCTPDEDQNRLLYYSKIVIRKLFELLTFTLYIRLMLQSFQLLLLSSISEIYLCNLSSVTRIFLYTFAIFILLVCIGFMILASVVAFKKSTQTFDTDRDQCEELFAGLKLNRLAYFYSVILMARRLFFITLLLCFQWAGPMVVVCTFASIQVLYTLWVVYIRYFDIVKDNVVEIYNECVYSVLLLLLIHFQTEDRWNQTITYAYMGLMMSCGFFLLVVSLGKCLFIIE